ncbi:MAG: hypothetical protein HC780_26600 [Leptolyngbyaceae cyanobacterium CSU_1_3]|nr:hypothetical protein [Leptolyngbyaceae cyanobacterium CSU_1_3]
MPRLSEKAFSILQTEIQNISSTDSAIQIQRELAIKRLQRLQSQEGPPLSYEEMRETLADLFPDFPEKVLRAAAKANKAPRSAAPKAPPKATVAIPWGAIKASSIALLILAGGIYAVNLPIPWLRLAVASKAPILLIPSFMSMDHHYRGAVNTVEQADQLINRATAPADFELGNTKVKAAQKHLDALPVWFVGYYPSEYCGFFGCSWRFTLDEFRAAREKVARMEARLFQEGNARTQLEEKDQALEEARQIYNQAKDTSGRSKAIAQWQAAIDGLGQIPQQTLAGRMAQEKLTAYERDFQNVVGFAVDSTRTGNRMEAARVFAQQANQRRTSPPSVTELQGSQRFWRSAIDHLEKITVDDPDFPEAQKRLANYTKEQNSIEVKIEAETKSVEAFAKAERLKRELLKMTTNDPQILDRGQVVQELQEIIDTLKQVEKGTTVYSDAQELMRFAQKRLK